MAKNAREKIYEAFRSLSLKKKIDKITVTDITDLAGVSRVSFYYHFRSIYDLAINIIEEDLRARQVLPIAHEDCEKALLILLEVIREHKELVKKLMSSDGAETLYEHTRLWSRHLADAALPECPLPVDEDAQKTILNFYRNAVVGAVWDWISDDCREDPQKLAFLLSNHLHNAYATRN
ncbi:MAG: TetR/AcrR family transcriptional regulator C-terminal domain-containing protein [Erysipelotrichaceae bacterium]|nr:TetR/AcrR family transcriptional regulator C-terminal domain-containing protein [Erysipelotrichaceae bacterium]